jgi:hypothetical protein
MRASSEAESRPRGRPALERGGVSPEGRPALERGGVLPEGVFSHRARQSLSAWCRIPRAKRSFARGGLGLTVLVGRWGRQVRGPLPLGRDRLERVLCLCFVICKRKWGFPRLFRGPLWLSLTVAPRAFAVVSVRIPQRLMLADGMFFPPGCCAVPWGRASAPAGVAPRSLAEAWVLLQGFFAESADVRGVSFTRHWQYFSSPRQWHAHVFDTRLRPVHFQEV